MGGTRGNPLDKPGLARGNLLRSSSADVIPEGDRSRLRQLETMRIWLNPSADLLSSSNQRPGVDQDACGRYPLDEDGTMYPRCPVLPAGREPQAQFEHQIKRLKLCKIRDK